MGSSSVNCLTILIVRGGVSSHERGAIFPFIVSMMSDAHSKERSRGSKCGLVRYTVVTSAFSTIMGETLACMSILRPTGISGPTIVRTLRVISPSASGNSSETAAPWRAKRIPSQGPLSSISESISPVILSYASFVIVPIGPVIAKNNGTTSISLASSEHAKYPATVVCDLAYSLMISCPL